jgi:DNA polymerase V
MPDNNRIYIAIDLKSFYASVECVERGLDALTTNLVVADVGRTEKTICLAVSPSLKSYGIPGRARLFEVIQKVNAVNQLRKQNAPEHQFAGKSYDNNEIINNPALELDYLAAPPRMALYMQYSTRIYNIYLRYVSSEDIHVYSVDEVFMDVTQYLKVYKMPPEQLVKKIIQDVYNETGITATAGIGTNMYLCKVAMDIVAKHITPDENGVRIAVLDEISYRKLLWAHRPITDFWRVGKGYARKLEKVGIYTMGDVARCSIGSQEEFYNENLLYKMFGKNAELLIDHAWGWEPCTIADVKAYRPENNSISTGQVLHCAYEYDKAELIVKEMTDLLVLDLVDKHLVTNQIVLTVGYDVDNLTDTKRAAGYKGEITTDRYGRRIPKPAHGTINLEQKTSSTKLIMDASLKLFEDIVDKNLLVRRINITANKLVDEKEADKKEEYQQLELFMDAPDENKELEKEKKLQQAMLDIKKKFGKNAVLKGMNLEEGATTIDRNRQIGGHRA